MCFIKVAGYLSSSPYTRTWHLEIHVAVSNRVRGCLAVEILFIILINNLNERILISTSMQEF